MDGFKCLWFISFGLSVISFSRCVKITELDVPRGASFEAHLNCKYDLENEKLYDVKWYKDDEQFFRCLTNETVQEYPVDGIFLKYSDMALQGNCAVTLTHLNSNSTGIYKCEVSLDYPTFTNIAKEAEFKFIEASKRTQHNNEALRNSNEVDEEFTSSTTNSATHIMEPWPFENNERFLVSGSSATISNHILVFIINLYLYCLYN